MQRVRVAGFAVSLDGFSAGTEQSLKDPLGKRGPEIFQWYFHTKTFRAMHGQDGGSIDVDDEFALPDFRRSSREREILSVDGVTDVEGRQSFRQQSLRIEIDHDLSRLASIRKR